MLHFLKIISLTIGLVVLSKNNGLAQCPTTTYPICTGESYTLTTQSRLTNIQWQIDNGTGFTDIIDATNPVYVATKIGKYRYAAKDANNCAVSLCCPFDIVTKCTTPVFLNIPTDTIVSCSGGISSPPPPSVSDACGNPLALTFTEITTDSVCDNKKKIVRTWAATDVCGTSQTARQTITVNDTIAPIISNCPANISVDTTTAIPALPSLIAADNCADIVNIRFSETRNRLDRNCDFNLVRTWTATDKCGNTSTCRQTIIVAAICSRVNQRCGRPFGQDSVAVTNACTANPKICVNIPFDSVSNYNIIQNGSAYTGAFERCDKTTRLNIERGRSRFIFNNSQTGCSDTLTVNAACLTPQYIESSMLVESTDTFCIETNELLGTRYRSSTLVPSSNKFARFTDLATTPTCISRLGIAVGVEKLVYVVSDEYGLSDTTFVTTSVYNKTIKRPKAFADTATTIKSKSVLIDVLGNDTLNTNVWNVGIATQPLHGKIVITPNFRLEYTPNADFCNGLKPDVFTYELCNQGGCDTTKVEVTVTCDKIIIYNGFSPNDDGVNDVFTIEGIEKYPNNMVRVYSRWGTEVMKTSNYQNNWMGKWQGVNLPDGIYFYIFDDGEGSKKTGYIQILR